VAASYKANQPPVVWLIVSEVHQIFTLAHPHILKYANVASCKKTHLQKIKNTLLQNNKKARHQT